MCAGTHGVLERVFRVLELELETVVSFLTLVLET